VVVAANHGPHRSGIEVRAGQTVTRSIEMMQ
jgi:hypothetical protein